MTKSKKIIPRGKYVLVKPTEKESNQTSSGLYKPDSDEHEQKSYGTVISFGDEVNGIKKGAIAVYGTYAGEHIKIEENGIEVEYKLVYDDDIIAFIE